MKKIRNEKGITLIALVITIIVLLILAAITLSTLAGRRGIINQAQNAEKEHTKAAALEDITLVTYQSLDNKGNTDTTKLEQGLNDIGATIIEKTEAMWIVELNGYTFEVDIEEGDVTENIGSYGGIYSEPGLEGKIAPTDLFEYEIINTGETASLATNSLPEKEAKITRINLKYCNENKYIPKGVESSYIDVDTNYEIIYEGEHISDILVIPYQVELGGELYKITSVDLRVYGNSNGGQQSFPFVNTIIYPNTVTEIFGGENQDRGLTNGSLRKIILPSSISSIPDYLFEGCNNLKEIVIESKNITSIGRYAYHGCDAFKEIIIPTGTQSIGEGAFYGCENLETITIPKSVTSIGESAFWGFDSLTTVNYEGTEEEWKKITIGSYNFELENATINYNYKI